MVTRRNRKKQKDNIKGISLIIISLSIVMIFLKYYLFFKSNQIERDLITMCRVDNLIQKETAVIFDITDKYSTTQAILTKKEITSILDNSLIDERFTFYTMSDDVDNNIEKFIVCNPGDSKGKSEWTSNIRRLNDKWNRSFFNKIVDSTSNITGKDYKAISSPIIEMIKYISINTMYNSPAKEKMIIIVSDMLHHTNDYSHYKYPIDYHDFSKTNYSIEQTPYLSNVNFSILYLTRSDSIHIQNRGHIAFWENYINLNGGKVLQVKRVN